MRLRVVTAIFRGPDPRAPRTAWSDTRSASAAPDESSSKVAVQPRSYQRTGIVRSAPLGCLVERI